jgi:hypothetical protein
LVVQNSGSKGAEVNPIDDAHNRLHRNGWSTGDIGMLTEHGPCLLVTCTRGEHFLQTMAPTQAEAWQETCRQAEALGMLER